MTFSRECEYALKGLATLVTEGGGRPLMLSEIAAHEDLPQSFLSKIFQKLLKHGLVVSRRGVQRGYTLAREARAIPLRTIVEAIEGPDRFDRCVFAHSSCRDENPCLAHLAWGNVRPQVKAAFERTSLQDLVDARAAGPPQVSRRGRAKPA
jgi:Rrf2 family protein